MDFTFTTFERRIKLKIGEVQPLWIWGDVHRDCRSYDDVIITDIESVV